MLFRKAAVIADCHFGRGSNSTLANQDNLDFLAWAIDDARTWGAETCIMLGDWFDNRHAIGLATMHAALQGLEMLSRSFQRTWFISGNHDLYHRNQRDISSIEFAKHVPNVIVVNDPTNIDGVSFLPWLVGDEHKTLDLRDVRYVFGHLELPGFLLNARVVMPETAHTPSVKQFAPVEWCFCGHFHQRQFSKNICYIGNVMPFNFNDDGDEARGLMLLEWGREPYFKAWPSQPTYRSVKLSELLDNADRILKQNMTLKIAVDIPLQYEEASAVRESLVANYGLRKVELNHYREEIDQEFVQTSTIQTIDQLVIQGLQSIDSIGLSKERLIQIYTSL
jgi:DNA repair exonuclease SbcCD nuclease subunit